MAPKYKVGDTVTIVNPDPEFPPVSGVVQSITPELLYTITYLKNGRPHEHTAHERIIQPGAVPA